MGPRMRGYWFMTWLGLVANLLALPAIGVLAFRPDSSAGFQVTNISLAFSWLGRPRSSASSPAPVSLAQRGWV